MREVAAIRGAGDGGPGADGGRPALGAPAAGGGGRSGGKSAAPPASADAEMAARCRAHDWAATALGPAAGWPPALRAAARLVLDAPGAMCLYAGPAFLLLYNDAYRRVLGAKHPAALGRPAAGVWAEIWPALAPQYAQVAVGGPGIALHDVPFTLARLDGGAAEEAWFDYALSAVRNDQREDPRPDDRGRDPDAGPVLGVLAVVTETTARVRADRALADARAAADLERRRLLAVLEQLRWACTWPRRRAAGWCWTTQRRARSAARRPPPNASPTTAPTTAATTPWARRGPARRWRARSGRSPARSRPARPWPRSSSRSGGPTARAGWCASARRPCATPRGASWAGWRPAWT